MINERIAETVRNIGSKLHKIILGKIKCRNNLIVEGLVHEAVDNIILHAVTNDVLAGKVCSHYEGGVSAV